MVVFVRTLFQWTLHGASPPLLQPMQPQVPPPVHKNGLSPQTKRWVDCLWVYFRGSWLHCTGEKRLGRFREAPLRFPPLPCGVLLVAAARSVSQVGLALAILVALGSSCFIVGLKARRATSGESEGAGGAGGWGGEFSTGSRS